MISANQTPGGHKVAPFVASQLWRANQQHEQQYVREIRNLFSDKKSVVFRDFGGNDYRLRPVTNQVKYNDRLQQAVSLIICASESDRFLFGPDSLR